MIQTCTKACIAMRRGLLPHIFSSLLLLFLMVPVSLLAQSNRNITVKGKVTDDKNAAIAGASVTVKTSTAGNGSTGTSTDASGNFTLSVAPNATLVFTATGLNPKEISVAGKTTINVQLTISSTDLDQVVVVGYGTQRKKDVTGSVASVSGEALREVPAPNIIAQLKGRTAGVTITSNSATPGGAGQIRIRGNRTISNSQSQSDNNDAPLLVVDGVAYGGSINDIAPEDIASLDILKDASATAIFGSRGSGGVILITTKRGRIGKSILTFDSYFGKTDIFKKYSVFNGQEYAQLKADAATYNRTSPGTSAYPLTPAEQAALAAGVSTDWQDLIYKSGFQTNYQLGLTGGAENTQYGLSMGYYNETGIIPNQKFERYSLRTSIDQRIGKIFRLGLSSANTLSYSNTPGGGGVPSGLVRLTPLAQPYNTDGSVNLYPAIGSIDAAAVSPLTLITRKDAILARNRRLRTFNSLYGEVQLAPGLRYRLNVGLDFRQDNGNSYNGPNTYTNTATVQSSSNASVNNTEAYTYQLSNLLYYDKTFGKHKLGFTGLYEVTKTHGLNNQFNATGVYADYIQTGNLFLANTVTAVNNPAAFQETGLLSYMGRINYGFDNRYLLTATVRVDGSSTLAPGKQYFTYPAIGAGWTVTNESFMQGISFLSNLKVRGGWGISGNRNVDPYSTLGLLSTSTYNFGTSTAGQQPAYLVTQLANSALSWQSTTQTDVGIDFGFFKNRITGSVDYYDQRTKDILLSVNLPYSNGAGSYFANLGRTSGRGLEVNMTTVNVRTKSGLTWSTDLNFYFNREKITQLTTPDEKENKGNGWFVGQPLSVIYDVRKIGIWQTEDSAKGTLATQTSPRQYPGQIRVEDLNGDGKIDANDRQVLGNFQPNWEGGMTNRVSYKNFDLSVVIFARMGQQILVPYLTADGGANGFPFFNQGRVNQIKTSYWTRSNPTNDFPAPDAGTDRPLYTSTLGYRDGSFIKCRSINLGYEVTSSRLKRAGVSSLRFYLNATNPFIIYSPLVKAGLATDPEGNGYGGAVSAASSDVGVPARQISVNLNNPPVRQYTIGLNARF